MDFSCRILTIYNRPRCNTGKFNIDRSKLRALPDYDTVFVCFGFTHSWIPSCGMVGKTPPSVPKRFTVMGEE